MFKTFKTFILPIIHKTPTFLLHVDLLSYKKEDINKQKASYTNTQDVSKRFLAT